MTNLQDASKKSRTCTTHHHACDCREKRFEEIHVKNVDLEAKLAEGPHRKGTLVPTDQLKEMQANLAEAKAVLEDRPGLKMSDTQDTVVQRIRDYAARVDALLETWGAK